MNISCPGCSITGISGKFRGSGVFGARTGVDVCIWPGEGADFWAQPSATVPERLLL